jgi:photosystem II stability/assembly factor-like uncharacterized protein
MVIAVLASPLPISVQGLRSASVQTGSTYQVMDWTSAMDGWIVGPGQSLYHTLDGGRSWVRQKHSPLPFDGIDMKHGFVWGSVGQQLTLSATIDGGQQWESALTNGEYARPPFILDRQHLWSLSYLNPTADPRSGQPISIACSANGGNIWTELLRVDPSQPRAGGIPLNERKLRLFFATPLDGWLGAVTADGHARLYFTHDGGRQWWAMDLQ